MRIAVFDSGIGGLSVLHHAMRVLGEEQFIFYADEDHVPYGVKPREEVLGYVDAACKFLMEQGVKAIVLACNTATSVAAEELRRRYELPIIGMEPAVKRAIDLSCEGRVLVTATPITVAGRKMQNLVEHVDPAHRTDLLPLPRLVEFAEALEFGSRAVSDYLREAFAPYDFSRYSSVVLGCTHFNYFKDAMRGLLPGHVRLVDGNEGTVRELARRLRERGELERLSPSVEYFYSGRPVTDAAELARIGTCLERLDRMYGIS